MHLLGRIYIMQNGRVVHFNIMNRKMREHNDILQSIGHGMVGKNQRAGNDDGVSVFVSITGNDDAIGVGREKTKHKLDCFSFDGGMVNRPDKPAIGMNVLGME